VNDIEYDSKGNIWIGTDNGLIKWDGSTFSVLDSSDGLPDDIVTAVYSDSRKGYGLVLISGKQFHGLTDRVSTSNHCSTTG